MTLEEAEERSLETDECSEKFGNKIDFKGASFYFFIPYEDPLLPTETSLEFSLDYLRACQETPPIMDCIGLYSMGWQL